MKKIISSIWMFFLNNTQKKIFCTFINFRNHIKKNDIKVSYQDNQYLLKDNVSFYEEAQEIPQVQSQLPQVQAPPLRTPMPAPISPVSQQTQSTQANTYASLFPRDELGNLIAQKKNI